MQSILHIFPRPVLAGYTIRDWNRLPSPLRFKPSVSLFTDIRSDLAHHRQ